MNYDELAKDINHAIELLRKRKNKYCVNWGDLKCVEITERTPVYPEREATEIWALIEEGHPYNPDFINDLYDILGEKYPQLYICIEW